MAQKRKIEMFMNWLMDNNYISQYYQWFQNKFKIYDLTYTRLIAKLQSINYRDFVSFVDNNEISDTFGFGLAVLSWEEYCNKNF